MVTSMSTQRYAITFTRAAERALRKADRQVQRRLLDAIEDLRDDPRPPGAKTLQGGDDLVRVRVGDYRIVYRVHDDELEVVVVTLGHRREVYRGI